MISTNLIKKANFQLTAWRERCCSCCNCGNADVYPKKYLVILVAMVL
uniref:Uncharacterized protein n=1 Tax=Rhizophora mucronata TaxID=61149 RepID=A0A2P2PUB8_RHIMU